MGALLGLGILFVRRHLPESPRWLFIHGREEEADEIVAEIESEVEEETGEKLDEPEGDPIKVQQREVDPVPRDRRHCVRQIPEADGASGCRCSSARPSSTTPSPSRSA